MLLDQALAIVKAAGFRVTKPKQSKVTRRALNAIGKPYSPQYDPKYKIKHKPSLGASVFPYGDSTNAHRRSPDKALQADLFMAEVSAAASKLSSHSTAFLTASSKPQAGNEGCTSTKTKKRRANAHCNYSPPNMHCSRGRKITDGPRLR
jgi:hypothetical protein